MLEIKKRLNKVLAGSLFLPILFLTSCMTPLTPYNLKVRLNSDKPLEQRLASSKELIAKRKQQALWLYAGRKSSCV